MTTSATSRVVSPMAEVRKREMSHRLAPRGADLSGKTVGFLHNEKGWASDTFFEHDTEILQGLLQQRFKLKGSVRRTKPLLSRVAPKAIIDELAATSDVVVNGIGK
ncbi:MAG: hypothetical protein AAB502_03955 [Chloroflexota bacterium]